MNAATKLSKRVGQPQTKKCVLYSQQLFRKCFCSRFVPIKFALSNICCLLLTPHCYELLSYCLNEHPGFTGLVAPLFSKRRGVPPLQMKGRKAQYCWQTRKLWETRVFIRQSPNNFDAQGRAAL